MYGGVILLCMAAFPNTQHSTDFSHHVPFLAGSLDREAGIGARTGVCEGSAQY